MAKEGEVFIRAQSGRAAWKLSNNTSTIHEDAETNSAEIEHAAESEQEEEREDKQESVCEEGGIKGGNEEEEEEADEERLAKEENVEIEEKESHEEVGNEEEKNENSSEEAVVQEAVLVQEEEEMAGGTDGHSDSEAVQDGGEAVLEGGDLHEVDTYEGEDRQQIAESTMPEEVAGGDDEGEAMLESVSGHEASEQAPDELGSDQLNNNKSSLHEDSTGELNQVAPVMDESVAEVESMRDAVELAEEGSDRSQ